MDFGVIGCGHLGKVLSSKLANEFYLNFILCRNKVRKDELKNFNISESKVIANLNEIKSLPDVFVVAVSDNAIVEVIHQIAEQFQNQLQGKYFFHTSGITSTDEFKPLINYNVKYFAAHPFQTFYNADASIFNNLIWGVEKGNTSENEISDILNYVNGIPLFLDFKDKKQRILYHLTAVATSNFLKGAIEFAKYLSELSNLNNTQIIEQIVVQSIKDSFSKFGTNEFPLTGPLARKDELTIKKHLNALSDEEDLYKIYSYFSLATLELMKKNGNLTNEEFKNLRSLFNL
jgi:predicted short-subunit dehydrogenase-like oxidoreductase (DUF2520 family)